MQSYANLCKAVQSYAINGNGKENGNENENGNVNVNVNGNGNGNISRRSAEKRQKKI